MSTVRLRNINPLGQVDVPILARQGEPYGEHGIGCLEPGEVFEVAAELAGRPPKLAKDGSVAIDEKTGQPIDPGEGLLAQTGNYELADKPRRRAAAKKATRKRPPAKKAATPPMPPASPAAEQPHSDVKEAGQ